MQDAYDKLSRTMKEVLPYLHKQALVNQQQGRAQRAFVDYQLAYDEHSSAKAEVNALEARLVATAGALLHPCTPCA